jgi:hypothetical protein
MLRRRNKEMAVPKYVGTVQRTDIEGGSWLLQSDQGVTYQLKGGDSALLVDGLRAEVDGRIATKQLGIAMMGDILEVVSYRLLD